MGKIVSLKADIPANRELRTLSELAHSEFFGMWRDRRILTPVLNSLATCGSKAGTLNRMILIDTDVLVGCLRGSTAARATSAAKRRFQIHWL